MKTIKIIIYTVIAICSTASSQAQQLNFASLAPEQRHVVNANVSWDYGLVFGIGYGYQLNTKLPAVVHASFSFPSGENVFDDFKTKIGGTVQVVKVRDFRASAVVEGVIRRYENAQVRIMNFGSDMKGVVGYYKPKWYVAGEFGFDKAISSHLKHSDSFHESYTAVQDGWYVPTGGNFYYGLQTGLTLKSHDISLRGGKTISQDFKTAAMVPLYSQWDIIRDFNNKILPNSFLKTKGFFPWFFLLVD